jgi:hypothetical protein
MRSTRRACPSSAPCIVHHVEGGEPVYRYILIMAMKDGSMSGDHCLDVRMEDMDELITDEDWLRIGQVASRNVENGSSDPYIPS